MSNNVVNKVTWNCTQPYSGNVVMVTIQPINLLFVIIFGLLLFIQFLGSLAHQTFNLLQVVASTSLFRRKSPPGDGATATPVAPAEAADDESDDEDLSSDEEDVLELATEMQRIDIPIPIPDDGAGEADNVICCFFHYTQMRHINHIQKCN